MSQTILVVDDSQTIRKVVKMALKVAPFEVVSVGSGQEAIILFPPKSGVYIPRI